MNKIIVAVIFAGLAFMIVLSNMMPSVNPKYFFPVVGCVYLFIMFTGKYAKRTGLVKRVRTK